MQIERTIRLLSHEDVLRCGAADMILAEDAVRKSFLLVNENKACMPKKTILNPQFAKGPINIMPCSLNDGDSDLSTVKFIGTNLSNDSLFPKMGGIITIFDDKTKTPLCIMDVEVISAFRTGAVTRLAGRHILNNNIETVLLIGAGLNMKTQLLAITPFITKHTKIYVHSRGNSKLNFIKDMQNVVESEIIALNNIYDIVTQADVIIGCIPNVLDPVIKNIKFKDGVTFFNIGLIDCDPELIPTMDRIIVDDWESNKARGDAPHVWAYERGLIKDDDVESIIPIITNKEMGRKNSREKIFFSPVGFGSHDAVLAQQIYQISLEQNIGTDFVLSKFSKYI